MNPLLHGFALAWLVANEARKLHVVKSFAYVKSEYRPATDSELVFVDGAPLIDVPHKINLMEVEAARMLIQDMLLAHAYPNGL
jgi:hypothetical protein